MPFTARKTYKKKKNRGRNGILLPKLFWPTVRKNSRPSASNFKSFSRSLEQFFLTVGQNNFGNKIPYVHMFI